MALSEKHMQGLAGKLPSPGWKPSLPDFEQVWAGVMLALIVIVFGLGVWKALELLDMLWKLIGEALAHAA